MKYLLIALISMTSACKRNGSESTTNSLENYASADGKKIVVNQCTGPYHNTEHADLEHADVPEHLRAEFDQALSAIPLAMREIFSTKMLGKYVVSENAQSACKNALQGLSEERLNTGSLNTVSCLRGIPGEPGIEMVIPATKASLRHALVRAFFSSAFTSMAASDFHRDLGIFVASKRSPEWQEIERQVVLAFRSDLQAANADTTRMSTIFGKDLSSASSLKKFAAKFQRLSQQRRQAIGLAVLREAADQYYCSPETRKVMRQQFAATYKAFKAQWVEPVHAMLEEQDPETLLQENVLASVSADQSFALWGRWGPGNGPLRAWGASRMSARQAGGRGLFPNWNLARQRGWAAGGTGVFPNWQLSRQQARNDLRAAGYPGNSLFPNYWANRVLN